jgi:hypothetical protein
MNEEEEREYRFEIQERRTTMSHAITINVSDTLYEQLRQAASLFHRPTETIIVESLRHTLPPLFEDIPSDYQDEVFPLLSMTDQELLHEAEQVFPQERWQTYETLLERKKTGALKADEEKMLSALRHEADSLTFRRSYAMVLLKRRGYRVPALHREAGGV